MTTIRNDKSSVVAFSFVLLVMASLACGGLIGFPAAVNQRRLMAFAQALHDYPVPEGAMITGSGSAVANQGNGNSCTYQAWLDITTELDLEEVTAYYRDVELPSVSLGPQHAVPIRVELRDSDQANDVFAYRLAISQHSEIETFDYRCH